MTKNIDSRFFSPKLVWAFMPCAASHFVWEYHWLDNYSTKKLNLPIVSRLELS